MKRLSIIPSVLTVVLVTRSAPAHAQQFYVGGGYGYTFVKGFRDRRNIAFFVELESRGPLGVRLEGNETTSVLFLTANVTYALGSRDAPLQPYLVGGVGTALTFNEEELTLNAGGGLRFNLNSKLALFAEARVFLDSVKSRLIAPVTVGARVGL